MDYASQATSVFSGQQSGQFLPGRMLLQLTRKPEHIALVFRQQRITNAQLLEKIVRLTALLKETGVKPGSIVACMLDRSPDSLVLLLALWCCEASYLPLDNSLPQMRLKAIIELAQVDTLISHAHHKGYAERLPCPLITLEAVEFSQEEPILPAILDFPETRAEQVAYILFTSGSTGQPKGVAITQANLQAFMDAALDQLDIPHNWHVLGCNSFYFDIVFFDLLAPILREGTLILADQEQFQNPKELNALIRQESISLVQATPALWQLILNQNLQEQSQQSNTSLDLKMALSIGEALHADTARQLYQHTDALWNLYGPTECTIWASAYLVTETSLQDYSGYLPIGKPLNGYKLSLHNDKPVEDAGGELIIAGPAVASGYLTGSDHSTAKFYKQADQHWAFYSGDFCFSDEQGLLHFVKRLDRQLKVNGYRIEAEEIELRLLQHFSISQAACLVIKAQQYQGHQLVAVCVARAGSPNKNKASLDEWLSQWLPEWMLPHRYLYVDHIPLGSNGKSDIAAVTAMCENNSLKPASNDGSKSLSAPASQSAQVRAVFLNVLEIEQIGYYDSFFDMGGNSMMSATLLLCLNEQFHTSVKLRDLLKTPPTVASVCALLNACAQQQTNMAALPLTDGAMANALRQ